MFDSRNRTGSLHNETSFRNRVYCWTSAVILQYEMPSTKTGYAETTLDFPAYLLWLTFS